MATKAVLHIISDKQRHHLPLLDALIEAAAGGADVLQIRDKKAPAAEIFEFSQTVRQRCQAQELNPMLLINDRVDIALALPADGVHLAGRSLPAGVVRQLRRQASWKGMIGCSVHSYEEALTAAESGVDYVTYGHVYASESHRDLPPRGLRELARIVEAISIPVVAIGGIEVNNLAPVLNTGVSGIAVIGSVLSQTEPRRAAYNIKEEMEKSSALPKYPFLL